MRAWMVAPALAATALLGPVTPGGAQSSPPAPVPSATPSPLPTSQPLLVRPMAVPLSAMAGRLTGNVAAAQSDGPTLQLTGKGSVTKTADRAEINVTISASDTSFAPSLSAISSPAAALQRKIDAIHGASAIVLNVNESRFSFNGDQSPYSGSAQLEVRIDDLGALPAVRAAIGETAGATMQSVRYDVANRASAFSEALAAANADIQTQLAAFASKSNLRVLSERQMQGYANNVQVAEGTSVRVEATVTATYVLAPP